MNTNPWSTALPLNVPVTYPATSYSEPGLKSLFYQGPDWQGRPTRSFAWYGTPEGATPEHPVPGILLVHGGGATALPNWVHLWNQRGFAALAMDTCGGVPTWNENPYFRECWPRHDFSGPNGWGCIEDAFLPPRDQWMFHAVSDVLYGHKLLESLPEVDASRIGITGISWGAVVTCIAASLQPALKFAIPVYGCGNFNIPESSLIGKGETLEQRKAWFDLWDPAQVLPQATVPFLWVAGTNDICFPLKSWDLSTLQVQGPCYRSLRTDFPHDHTRCWTCNTIFDFARSACQNAPLPQLSAISIREGQATCSISLGGRETVEASLWHTSASGCSQDYLWHQTPGTVTGKALAAPLSPLATTCFFSLKDSRGCQWTSPLLKIS